jgi:hypothetical protein
MLKKNEYLPALVVSAAAVCLCIVLLVKVVSLQQRMEKLMVQTAELSDAVTAVNDAVTAAADRIDGTMGAGFAAVNTRIDGVGRDVRATGKTARSVKLTTEAQFSKTEHMSGTFDSILEEQKKQRLPSVQSDAGLDRKNTLAADYMKHGEYKKAYDLFDEVLRFRSDDKELRFNTACALFYQNRMDSSHYKRIKEQFSLLAANGYMNSEMQQILDYIAAEEKAVQKQEADDQ